MAEVIEFIKSRRGPILNLNERYVTDDNVGIIVDFLVGYLKINPGIKCLRLTNSNLGVRAALEIGYLIGENETLETIDLTENRVNSMSVRYLIEGLEINTTLKRLILANNLVTTMRESDIIIM